MRSTHTGVGKSKKLKLLTLSFAAMMAVTGCVSGGESTPTTSAGGQNPGEGASAQPSAAPSNDVGEPVMGGIFKYASVGVQTGYDPIKRGIMDGPMSAIYDTLMRYDQTGLVVPYVAESLKSEDAKVWTMKLREGVKFHDGNTLDAESVVFNIKRHQDPANASSSSSYVSSIETVEAKDTLTVVFTLKEPVASFPSTMTTAAGAIASPKAVESAGEDFGRTSAVGAGPFTFGEWKPDQELKLMRNPSYWQPGLPYLDEYHELPMSDTETRFAAFQSGAVDSAWFQEPTQINWAQSNPDLANLYAPKGGVGGTGLVFQLQSPPFDDVRMRKAVAMAVNTEALNQALFQGSMPKMQGPFVEGSFWYNGESEWPQFDQAAAKALVEEYKADNGGEAAFTLGCHNAPSRRRYVELVQGMLTEVGMNVTLETTDVAEYVDRVFAKDFQVGCFPKNAPDPDLIYYPSFTCDGPITSNFFGYCDEEADAALTLGRQSIDVEVRKGAYADFEKRVAADLPMIWHWGDTFSIITRPNVNGFEANPSYPADWQPATLWLGK